jgi:Domain of unknown function (DUF4157)
MSASTQALLTTRESKTGKAGNASAQAKKPKLSPPISSSIDQVSFLQRTVGNRQVERLLKSGVSQDDLASGPSVAKSVFQPGPLVETNLATGQSNHPGNVASGEIATLPPRVQEVLRSPGQPLDPATRAFMEPHFHRSFSHVCVHADGKAAESARSVGALAYTVGQNVVFGGNSYAPTTHAGRKLRGAIDWVKRKGSGISISISATKNGLGAYLRCWRGAKLGVPSGGVPYRRAVLRI